MDTALFESLQRANALSLLILVASTLNVVLFLFNLWLGRRLYLRRQAVLRAERRMSGGPVTASLRERFNPDVESARQYN